MDIETLQNEIPNIRVDGKKPNEEKFGWIELSELLDFKYYIVYGDDGGDDFVKFAEGEEEFNKLLQEVVMGDTNCDFPTTIRIIVKEGEKYTPTIR